MVFSKIKIVVYRMLKVKIGKNCYIGPFVMFDAHSPNLIEIGNNVIISFESKLHTHEISHNKLTIGRILIGDNTVIGANSIIKCGVKIGSYVDVGMGCVVSENIPDNCIAIGNPMRIIPKNQRDVLLNAD
jgi:acetyltransferase-like isoleucine patch superfamily enzyme